MKPDYTACRMWRRLGVLCLIGAAGCVLADEPSRKPSDYPVRGQLGTFIVAAENLGPSVPSPSGSIFAQNHIAIEVAIFAQGAQKRIELAHANFALRINGKKTVLRPDTPGAVAASIKYPDWEQRGRVVGTAGIGDAGVILGRPPAVGRFPGDQRPRDRQGRVPNPVPKVDNPVERSAEDTPVEEIVMRAALPEGEIVAPYAGCLFFPFKGKMKSIKKLELIYEGPAGELSLLIP
jgi:hypothetical protein